MSSTFSRTEPGTPTVGAAECLNDAPPTHDTETRCLVVMYHYIREQSPFDRGTLPGLSPSEFSLQLDQLCRVLEPVSWPTFYAWTRNEASMARRSFLLTFDDGLAEHGRKVAAILESHGLHGTFFVPGSTLTSYRMLSAHATHLLLASLGEDAFREALYEELAGDRRCDRIIDSLDTRKAELIYHYETPTLAHLKYLVNLGLPTKVRSAAIQRLFEKHVGSSRRWAEQWYMSWDDLTALQSRGHTIGAHGYTHEPLVGLTPHRLQHDLIQSMNVLRDGLGVDARPMSYPFGRCDPSVIDAARRVGFVQAFTTQSSWIVGGTESFAIPRIDTIHADKHLGEAV